ncbi:PIN domain-containing protein [Nocardia abscessus]|uniref:PIN domain-containing protein n=1 Tax=Nocardia abscessus TaxID=120957 RepID=UPI0024567AF7|nr:PIN domain-containing protein [Nocardia abscessus]
MRRAADSAGAIVVSPLALTEVHHVASVRAGREVADGILALIADRVASTRLVISSVDAAQLHAAVDIRKKYGDLNLDLVDAVCVALADEFDTDAILTPDRRDFRTLRPLGRYPAFRILPDDLSPIS